MGALFSTFLALVILNELPRRTFKTISIIKVLIVLALSTLARFIQCILATNITDLAGCFILAFIAVGIALDTEPVTVEYIPIFISTIHIVMKKFSLIHKEVVVSITQSIDSCVDGELMGELFGEDEGFQSTRVQIFERCSGGDA